MQIPKRIASAVINSLKGGVVPRTGLPYITVGRVAEIDALLRDVEIISEGGASFRFIVGKYGSGKSFLLQTIRSHVMDKGFVVVDADLSPERRLQGTKGQGLATYKELMKNMSTKTRPDGGALSLILDRWISSVQSSVMTEKGVSPEDPGFSAAVDREIASVISSLSEMVHGFDFTRLLTMYCHACNSSDDETKAKVIKWFRGEYTTKTEAKNDLGVNIIITDDDWYEYLKLFALFLKMAGYSGMMILIDELVNIYKIPNAITRQYNYEKILTMYNDTLQGKAKYLGIIMGGTPQCIEDTRRGVYSYEALRSRLSESRFGGDEIRDMMAPVIRLTALTYEEMLVLTEKLADIHAWLFGYTQRITQEEMVAFLQTEFGRIGADSHITPREVIRDFIGLLDIAFQNPAIPIAQLIGQLPENSDDSEDGGEDQMFAEFDI
ncbi:MAG TPA: ATP-binding protein [Ruminococcus sp.]|nr:ATP-binding protein [Ruminococcus sp.]